MIDWFFDWFALLWQAIFAYVYSATKLIVFHFYSWLSFQRPCCLLRGLFIVVVHSVSKEKLQKFTFKSDFHKKLNSVDCGMDHLFIFWCCRIWIAITLVAVMESANGIDQICPANVHTSKGKLLSSHLTDMSPGFYFLQGVAKSSPLKFFCHFLCNRLEFCRKSLEIYTGWPN